MPISAFENSLIRWSKVRSRHGHQSLQSLSCKDRCTLATVARGGQNSNRGLEASSTRVSAAPVATHLRVHVLYDCSKLRELAKRSALEARAPDRGRHRNSGAAAHAYPSRDALRPSLWERVVDGRLDRTRRRLVTPRPLPL